MAMATMCNKEVTDIIWYMLNEEDLIIQGPYMTVDEAHRAWHDAHAWLRGWKMEGRLDWTPSEDEYA